MNKEINELSNELIQSRSVVLEMENTRYWVQIQYDDTFGIEGYTIDTENGKLNEDTEEFEIICEYINENY